MSTMGLSLNDIVNTSLSLGPIAAGARNFGALMLLGSSTAITLNERYRAYTSLVAVGGDFLTTSPEYLAAERFFQQTPTPSICYIGVWAQAAMPARVLGGYLGNNAAVSALVTSLSAVTAGSLNITVSGAQYNVEGTINLTGVTNMNAVAAAITTGVGAVLGTFVFNPNYNRIEYTTAATGTAATVSFAAATSGTDLAPLLGLTATTGGTISAGVAAESLETAAQALLTATGDWYALGIVPLTVPVQSDVLSVAGMVQASSPPRILLHTSQDAACLNNTDTSSLPYLFYSLEYWRTFCQYSSSDPYAAIGAFGIAATTNFEGSDTVITLMFKQPVGTTPESLAEAQAARLKAINCNVYGTYQNGANVLQWGTMSGGYFFDVVQGADWLTNQIRSNYFSLLQTQGRVPLTDPGVQQAKTAVVTALEQGVTNGLIGRNLVWSGPGFGSLKTGQTLPAGYYVYAPSVTTLSVAQRQARQAPLMQIAATFAGAVHQAGVNISVVE